MKNFRPILGISLLVQSLTFFILYLVNVEKKRNLARAFAAFAAIGGVSGAVLLYSEYKERKLMLEDFDEDYYDDFYEDFDELLEDLGDPEVDEDDISCSFENTEE